MATAAPEKSTLQHGQVVLSGRINFVRVVNGAEKSFLTLMTLPAPDSYSSPSTVEVRSLERFGAVGDEVVIRCRLLGFKRSFQRKDPETGIPSGPKIASAEHALQFIDLA